MMENAISVSPLCQNSFSTITALMTFPGNSAIKAVPQTNEPMLCGANCQVHSHTNPKS